MEKLLDFECEPNQLSPLALAFVGDAVYDLFVRERLVCQANRSANKLHRSAVESVRASAQAKACEKILPLLSQKEETIFKRGRNAHTNHLPKNGNPRDYHYATAMETLFGYLYLNGEIERLKELFAVITEEEGKNAEA